MKKLTVFTVCFLFTFNLFSQSIFEAIENKDYANVEKLSQKKSRIDKTSDKGITPLWKATLLKDTISMIILLRNGADPNAPTDGGVTPLFVPCMDGFVKSAEILCRFGADVNFDKNKYSLTPLRHATSNGNTEVVRFLINQGAAIDAKADDNATALTAACAKGHIEIVTLLLEKGADINVQDEDGDTPLMNACLQGRVEIVSYLLEKGANKKIKDKKGKTAIDIADEKGYPKIVKLLE